MPSFYEVDFLVLGSGVAGLTYALETAKHGTTLILTKKNRADSNSNWAQGGIAGVMSDDDDVGLHAVDTEVAGAGLCHSDAVQTLVTEGPERIRDLIRLGARFNMEAGPDNHKMLSLGREGGHSRNRIVHAADRTGWECEQTLLRVARNTPRLKIWEHYFVLDLAIAGEGSERRCVGAFALHAATGQTRLFSARTVLLATGGCGRVYQHTTNPVIATGDGVAMAWRADATIANMEFIQFHPTTLYHPEGHSFLISEAVRGEGGILRAADGSTFIERYHPLGALAPRDIVARAIHAERLRRGDPCVYLDVTHLEDDYLQHRFPTIYDRCKTFGIDISREWIPVVPAAHYTCGGVQSDLNGHTDLQGLYVAGEVACTGVHGANRLASNSLLEAMVFGRRAALDAVVSASQSEIRRPDETVYRAGTESVVREEIETARRRLQALMNDYVGIVRCDRDLTTALDQVLEIRDTVDTWVQDCRPDPDLYELRNMAQVAELIVRSALSRKESRGLHFTTDYPDTDDLHWKHDTVLTPEGF